MQKHTKIYYQKMGFDLCDSIPCERCEAVAVDIHHILGRGKDMDIIENLMALCRDCHTYAHSGNRKREMAIIHKNYLKTCPTTSKNVLP